ncbi:MAG TPA: transposase [Pyrinomonadaceae bacterium]|nr:transposase [Pyrinomonadaceae bacterium]
MKENQPSKIHKRGYLPHVESPELTQFVTFRLADSLPAEFFEQLSLKLQSKTITEIEYHRAIEKALDAGDGPTFLRDPRVAKIVSDALVHLDDDKYSLKGWVVMPNHVHICFKQIPPATVTGIMHSIKGYTANAVNKLLGRSGRFWSPDYFDRFIRDRKHLANVLKYIDENPVKAGLCKVPEEWPWGSAGYPT